MSKFWSAITGRSKGVAPKLDALFAIPSAAITLDAAMGVRPRGTGSVCFKAPSGAAFGQTRAGIVELLEHDPANPQVTISEDSFGFTWLVVDGDPADTSDLCTDLHAVNTALIDQGFELGLLCTLVPFVTPDGDDFGLVYLYKRGTFYPFAPRGGRDGRRRDSMLEFQVRDVLLTDGGLTIEPDHERWLALWGAPGL